MPRFPQGARVSWYVSEYLLGNMVVNSATSNVCDRQRSRKLLPLQDQTHLLLVGSEDGRLHKCSKTYNSHFLATYEGHAGAVYAVHWNLCHPDSFLSASADWTVKLWHNNRSRVSFSAF